MSARYGPCPLHEYQRLNNPKPYTNPNPNAKVTLIFQLVHNNAPFTQNRNPK